MALRARTHRRRARHRDEGDGDVRLRSGAAVAVVRPARFRGQRSERDSRIVAAAQDAGGEPHGAPHRELIAVVGPGDVTDPIILDAAERIGALLAAAGHQVVTGGLGGVMAAATRGAKSAGGTVVAMLPDDDVSAATEFADV